MFVLTGVPAVGKTIPELEQAMRREVARIVSEGVSEEELKRASAQVVSSQVFQRDSIYFQAMLIGSLEIGGYSYQAMDIMIEKLKQVTATQVQEVAKKYLIDETLTVAVLDPQPLEGRKPAAEPAAGVQSCAIN